MSKWWQKKTKQVEHQPRQKRRYRAWESQQKAGAEQETLRWEAKMRQCCPVPKKHQEQPEKWTVVKYSLLQQTDSFVPCHGSPDYLQAHQQWELLLNVHSCESTKTRASKKRKLQSSVTNLVTYVDLLQHSTWAAMQMQELLRACELKAIPRLLETSEKCWQAEDTQIATCAHMQARHYETHDVAAHAVLCNSSYNCRGE